MGVWQAVTDDSGAWGPDNDLSRIKAHYMGVYLAIP